MKLFLGFEITMQLLKLLEYVTVAVIAQAGEALQ